jgi:hypothetical protein
MRFFSLLVALTTVTIPTMAQNTPTPPTMTFLYHMDADLADPFTLGGPIPIGDERVVIPIIGGTFRGPKISGESTSYQHLGARGIR